MKGHNTLRVNMTTMNLIVQQWVDREFATKGIRVDSVSMSVSDGVFAIKLVTEGKGEPT